MMLIRQKPNEPLTRPYRAEVILVNLGHGDQTKIRFTTRSGVLVGQGYYDNAEELERAATKLHIWMGDIDLV